MQSFKGDVECLLLSLLRLQSPRVDSEAGPLSPSRWISAPPCPSSPRPSSSRALPTAAASPFPSTGRSSSTGRSGAPSLLLLSSSRLLRLALTPSLPAFLSAQRETSVVSMVLINIFHFKNMIFLVIPSVFIPSSSLPSLDSTQRLVRRREDQGTRRNLVQALVSKERVLLRRGC